MEAEPCVPPGFRFHPTEEELVGYYLTRKISSQKFDLDVITDIDLYRMEPWDIQGKCKLGYEERNEWYFFSHKDKKYPTGTRTNRATTAGFWKATGRDKAVLSKNRVIGMRKTLVFYKGRAPNGNKTDWIMHEYRLQTSENGPPQEEGWVVCRAFKKPTPSHRQGFEAWNNRSYYIRDHDRFRTLTDILSPMQQVDPYQGVNYIQQSFGCEPNNTHFRQQSIELPQLDNSPSTTTSLAATNEGIEPRGATATYEDNYDNGDQFVDWKAVDKLLASQLTEMASTSAPSDLPLVTQDYDIDTQGTSFLDCILNL